MSSTDRKILVWDAPTRLFHWLIVALVVAAYATWRLNWMDWHAQAGNALLTLVLFRLLWGFFGSETTRFSRFLTSPRVALRHLAHMLRREPDRQAGHNPAGGWMVLILLALLLGEALTGLYVANDVADVGPFTASVPAPIANAITSLHLIFWDALLAAVALHVLAVLVYAVAKRHNLVLPMITGWKTLPDSVPQPRMVGPARVILLLSCSVLAAAALANFL
ncbi:MAG: cytochrome b/b6 domain-containing protein [Methyloceanibacter sp.]|jgi:cytochrome b